LSYHDGDLDIASQRGSTSTSIKVKASGEELAILEGTARDDIDVAGNFVELP